MMSTQRKPRVFLADLIHNQYIYNYSVPLNVACLAATLDRRFGDEVDARLFKFPDKLIEALEEKPEIVALANYDWNVNLNTAIMEIAREINPEVFIVMGGPNIRRGREGAMQFLEKNPLIDVYVLNEGEEAFGNIVEHMLGHPGSLHDTLVKQAVALPQLGYYTPGREKFVWGDLCPTASQRKIPHPSAWLSGRLDEFLSCRTFPLSPIVETTRGCPYACTYCTAWGTAATGIKSIRRYDLDVVYAELDYIFEHAEQEFYLMLGDANIGILERDIEIAQRVRDLADRHGKITAVGLDTSKNMIKRNIEVYRILGDLSIPTFAQQTFNEEIWDNIGRRNVSFAETKGLVAAVHANGSQISTDLLVGLPGETKEQHVNSLRMAFDAGFDKFQVSDIRLILGTDMEEDPSREKFGLKTKVRIVPNAFGGYGGRRVIDYEYCVRETNAMSQRDFLELRLFHAHIFLVLNLEFGRPLMDFAARQGYHPIALMSDMSIMPAVDKYPNLSAQFVRYIAQANSEWFDTRAEADAHYTADEEWKKLTTVGFPKLNYDYASRLVLDLALRAEFLDWMAENVKRHLPNMQRTVIDDVARFSIARVHRVPLEEAPETLELSGAAVAELSAYVGVHDDGALCASETIEFSVDEKHISAVRREINDYQGVNNIHLAVQLVLQFTNKALLRNATRLTAREPMRKSA
jgi:radical SAM superfamily enzyme YgiQ (UPF0313 family)